MTEVRPARAGYAAVGIGYALAIVAVLALSCSGLATAGGDQPCRNGGLLPAIEFTVAVSGLTLLIAAAIATFTIMSRRARRAAPISGGGATVKGLGIGLLVALPVAAVTYVLASLVGGLQCFN